MSAAESSTTDVVVIGAGASGLSAAYEAAKAGRNAVLLEKNPAPGGSTSWSVGSITASCTPHQRRAGIQDSADAHFEDMGLHAGALAARDNIVLRRLLVDHSSEMLNWLIDLGVVFVGPEAEPPHRVPRMHNVVPNSKSFAYHLGRHCRRLGVEIRCGVQSDRFIMEAGRVVGVEATVAGGKPHRFMARCAVVLASGDYSGAEDLKARFGSAAVAAVESVNPTATGDGHRMALAIGASVVNGDILRGPIMRFVPPRQPTWVRLLPPSRPLAKGIEWAMNHLPDIVLRPFLMSFLTTALGPSPGLHAEGAVLINKLGRRFTEESARPAVDVAQQPDRVAWILMDDAIARKFSAWPHFISTAPGVAYAYLQDYRRNRADIFHSADTLEDLAVSLGMPSSNLIQAIASYNTQERGSRPPLITPPFFALGPIKSYVVFTDGGLRVTERLQVVGDNGEPIPGLYAAGSAGQGGLLLEGHGHHLGWAFVSGRIAGRHAALEVGLNRP